jgi:hypothetical protein
MTAFMVGKTLPMVTPYPTWQSGMIAIVEATSGWRAALPIWSRAPGSISAMGNHDFTVARRFGRSIAVYMTVASFQETTRKFRAQ